MLTLRWWRIGLRSLVPNKRFFIIMISVPRSHLITLATSWFKCFNEILLVQPHSCQMYVVAGNVNEILLAQPYGARCTLLQKMLMGISWLSPTVALYTQLPESY